MPDNPRHEEIANPGTHHETSDVNVKALIWFAVIFVVFAIVAHLALGLLFRIYVRIERHRNTNQMSDIRQTPEMSLPKNQPLLQPFPHTAGNQVVPPYRATPVTDLADLRAGEDRVLHSYGWVDRQKGAVHIPIDEAMRLTLERGLPVQAGGGQAPSPVSGGQAPSPVPPTPGPADAGPRSSGLGPRSSTPNPGAHR